MVMEYVEGQDLKSLGILTESEALLYIRQIGEALTVVHDRGLLHRDVKPQNIIVRSGESQAVLIDFGIAREFIEELTQTQTVLFTPFYAPPEQYSPRAKRGAYMDVYSLAATLYKVITGKEPENALSRKEGYSLKSPKNLNVNISDTVNQAILQGMELNPANRPQSVQEWLGLLPQPFSIPRVSPQNTIFLSKKLILAVKIDYSELRDLLAAENWKDADIKTKKFMLNVANKNRQYWLKPQDIDRFPCEDLSTINQLWVKYSNGRFGFSVQKDIDKSLGGTRNYEKKIWQDFGDRVGWRVNGNWLDYDNLTFAAHALIGHLPCLGNQSRAQGSILNLQVLFSRVENCKL